MSETTTATVVTDNPTSLTERANETDSGASSLNGYASEKASVADSLEQQPSDLSMRVKEKADLSTLPTRVYLDQTVVPILLQGMSQLARERPSKPIERLASYLQLNKDKYGE